MPGVCVGCGLKVTGGLLEIEGGGACGQADVGVICTEEGGLDYNIPLMGRRVVGGVSLDTAYVSSAGYNAAVLLPNHFSTTHDSASGVMEVNGTGGIEILCPGVYTIHLTGGPTNEVAETNRMLGGRVRLFRNGTIVASSGMIAYDDPSIDYTSASGVDGPEWSCSTVQPLVAGQVITWEVVAVTDVDNATILWPVSVNAITIARLGSSRA